MALLASLSASILLIAATCCAGAQTTTSAALPPAPKGLFGISPQTGLSERDAEYMKAGGIEAVRYPLVWSEVQATRNGGYNWDTFDGIVGEAARQGLQVLPFIVD